VTNGPRPGYGPSSTALVLDELGARSGLDWSRCPIDFVSDRTLDSGQGTPTVPAQRKARREYENRVSALISTGP
jgi:hypothetical protein